ncbi:Guanine nucleotide-binding protein, beta subunit [Parasponia andersonii]|uniref:Guanine nucleotide-binding protein, beta subunit n=1 Tax=Parasponia andersonii TaxID=3476 RepID=A0A2P5DI81_PARAD|nr:Guanine nucleotide-binding protein, beta subunit [Parasponia andersonii]
MEKEAEKVDATEPEPEPQPEPEPEMEKKAGDGGTEKKAVAVECREQAPVLNIAACCRLREYGESSGTGKSRQFVYSRFRIWRAYQHPRFNSSFKSMKFLRNSHHVVAGCYSGEVKFVDLNSNRVIQNGISHRFAVSNLQCVSGHDKTLVLSSNSREVMLWRDAYSLSEGAIHSFEECKLARCSNAGDLVAATHTRLNQIRLFDIQTCRHMQKFTHPFQLARRVIDANFMIHFHPLDTLFLCHGILWDSRTSTSPVHRFEQITDYRGGGFHPSGNEVIINSGIWDLRSFKQLHSSSLLDQTRITFNAGDDVIYAFLNSRGAEDNNFGPGFLTLDAKDYSLFAKVQLRDPVTVTDFAVDPTDSVLGLTTLSHRGQGTAVTYQIGRQGDRTDRVDNRILVEYEDDERILVEEDDD